MVELSEPGVAAQAEPAVEVSAQISKAKHRALDLMLGAQKTVLEEIVFVGNELLDRAQTETQLLTEFISKLAAAHSVKDVRSMLAECSQHQIDFIRRDNERLYKHGIHAIESASKLLNNRPGN